MSETMYLIQHSYQEGRDAYYVVDIIPNPDDVVDFGILVRYDQVFGNKDFRHYCNKESIESLKSRNLWRN